MSGIESDDFDFDTWAALAERDPEAFERRRREAIEQAIDSAPEHVRRRLVGLQWQVDRERERAGSPLGACVKVSALMWRRVAGPDGLLDSLETLARAAHGETCERERAAVLPFPGAGPADD